MSYTKICGKSILGRRISICKGPVLGNEQSIFKEQPAGQPGGNGSAEGSVVEARCRGALCPWADALSSWAGAKPGFHSKCHEKSREGAKQGMADLSYSSERCFGMGGKETRERAEVAF